LKILQGLLSGSDSSRQEALNKASLINDFESSEILKSIVNEIETASKIEIHLFKSFLEWGGSRPELYSDTISCLNRIPTDKIKRAFIPRIKEFGEKAGKTAEIQELFTVWEKETSTLEAAINNE
jgi:hypothetical protein